MSNFFSHELVRFVPKQMPVFTAILDDYVEFNENLKEIILEHRQKNPTAVESNVKAWQSSWVTHLENPKFQPLANRIVDVCEFITEAFYKHKIDYSIVNMWAMMYEETEETVKHCHFPSDFSCCYYVDVEPDCAPIIFEDELIVKPENGMLAIWSGLLQHEVPPTKGKRMCVSANALRTSLTILEQEVDKSLPRTVNSCKFE
tara:strand:- start:2813 stop:3418 length:606 start_codon:yes stop_codon:yes gene_type:complete